MCTDYLLQSLLTHHQLPNQDELANHHQLANQHQLAKQYELPKQSELGKQQYQLSWQQHQLLWQQHQLPCHQQLQIYFCQRQKEQYQFLDSNHLSSQDSSIQQINLNHIVQQPPLQLPNQQHQHCIGLEEIKQSMSLVASLMPEMFTQRIVRLFYQRLISKTNHQQLTSENINHHPIISNPRNSSLKQPSIPINQTQTRLNNRNISNCLRLQAKERALGLTDAQFRQRKQMRQLVGQAFCKGIGYQGAKAAIKINNQLAHSLFNSIIHDQILEQLLLQIQQQVQRIVIEGYNMQVSKIVCAEVKSIQRVMCDCRELLRPQTCQILFKTVEQYCSKEQITVGKEEGMRMLQGINQGLTRTYGRNLLQIQTSSKRKRELRRKQEVRVAKIEDPEQVGSCKYKFELHRMWNSEFEKLFVSMCQQGAHLAAIRQTFTHHYPTHPHLFTLNALRSMLTKILRLTIRRLLREYKEKKRMLPQLTKINDQIIKNIINCTECRAIRSSLFELYMSEDWEMEKLSQNIMLINRLANKFYSSK